MKKRTRIILAISAALTVFGIISLIFAWSSAIFLSVGFSVSFCIVLSWLLKKYAADRTPLWFTLLFAASFIPIILCFYFSAEAGINGTGGGFIFPRKQGWVAFSETFAVSFILMTVIPLIPSALIIQIRYITGMIKRSKIRKRS